ncbi:biotin carboxylase N-terminal domain-containing protein [Arthrobacter sp. M4]|uniref:acetyl/propionyl/methylcrotonyl-CoA carboxylase subunit alpha n=1 Tax=Arthrobacter sp. M4 TaxID=218160 RepID=UPI001CDB6347|nr:biotin carboxylase N-terminal domain-containing protein [Arthrobacter sp. M4]MCA4133740.1 acetyl/propionyl-CoA carboxylase subunit alpha [Arthrobacter sp. M4]
MFRTVLVANRGEIACRVIRTLKSMGIRAVAVYSDADANARHVGEADAAVRLGPAPAAESYLNIEAIIRACRASGAEAVHPGYGFLSENSTFARALQEAGIVFIGPGPEALAVMGDKIRSKNHVASHGVPVVPGIARPGMNDDELEVAARRVGYPLLIKPSAGGGGKGMHIVERHEDLMDELAAARRVASGAFGDDTLFLERLVRSPRHIEVQVLADNHGNVIHLGERECSLQRRHQKVIEEAPSPLVEAAQDPAALRDRLGEAACNAARSVHYSGAGTVEFLVSDEHPDEFFFMEMNTRLQVEHPVTEMVTGVDLVEWQVRIAAGERLTLAQADVELSGHAAEARVYAEVPRRSFIPSAGTVLFLDEPDSHAGGPADTRIRVDSGVKQGQGVSSDYDPMVAKVIAWGADRTAALSALDEALGRYTLLGVDTNVEYLRLLVNDDDVRSGHLDTGLIERKLPGLGFRELGDSEVAAAALYALSMEGPADAERGRGPWHHRDGWRLGAPAPRRVAIATPDGGIKDLRVSRTDQAGEFQITVDGGPAHLASLKPGLPGPGNSGYMALEFDGGTITFAVAVPAVQLGSSDAGLGSAAPAPSQLWLGNAGWAVSLGLPSREERLRRKLAAIGRVEGAADPQVRSPMPGTVVSIGVGNGDVVDAGEVLVSVEAMKMEHRLVAPIAGTVHIAVRTGDLVKADQVVATIHTAPANPVPANPAQTDSGDPSGVVLSTTIPETGGAVAALQD